MEVILGLIALLGLGYSFYQKKKLQKNLDGLAIFREGETSSNYMLHFISLGYREDIVSAAYKNLRNLLSNPSVQLSPADNLELNYLLNADEIKDLLIDICLDLCLDLPKNKEVYDFEQQNGKIVTIEKVIQYVMTKKQ